MIFYRRLSPIKAITFDLDDTFYDNHPYIKKAEQALFDYLFKHYSGADRLGVAGWRAVRRSVLGKQPELQNDMIRLRKTILTELFAQIAVPDNERLQAVESAFDFFYQQRSHFKVIPEYCALLSQLSQRVPLIAITNGNVDLARIGIAPYFQASLHASVEQPMKPHPKMFLMAQQQLGVPARHILHVGDSLQKDVAGALKAGYQAAWYADNRSMNMRLEKTSLLPHVQLSALAELADLLDC